MRISAFYQLILIVICFSVFGISTGGFDHKLYSKYAPPPHIHSRFAYVSWTKEKGYDIKTFGYQVGSTGVAETDDDLDYDWVAKARFQNFVNKTGWSFLEVETKETYPDEIQAHAAGIAEGFLTRDLIYNSYQNLIQDYCAKKSKLCKFLYKYLKQNVQWTQKTTQQFKANDPYWHQIGLMEDQFQGMMEGYNWPGKKVQPISEMEFIFFNIMGDLGDLESALSPSKKRALKNKLKGGHCSVLIKLIEKKDLYVAHDTWAGLSTMLRINKRYNFQYHLTSEEGSKKVPGESLSLSSYPGMLYSMDDFYLISSGLLVTETTIMNYNDDLWKFVKPTNSLMTMVRTMVANRLAENGLQWTKIFSKYNSGTYNNQWMVIDYNRFEPERQLNDGLLMVAEQMPGNIVARDVTQVLRDQGYWSSFNIPYFPEIFQSSQHPKMVEKFGDFFTHDGTPRSKIFARDQGKVTDLESMMKLMRYNDFTHDPLSKCNCTPPFTGVAAISARGDLNPKNGTYPFPMIGHRESAGTDMKLTNLDLFMLQRFIAIAGPTYDPLPPFQWSKASPDIKSLPHFGMPDKFEFEPIIHQWKWL